MSKEITDLQKSIEIATEYSGQLTKSQMSLFGGEPHHKEYTRTNASGKVSQIAAKGAPTTKEHLPGHFAPAGELSDRASNAAWTNQKEDSGLHKKAEEALHHSSKLHELAAEEAELRGDTAMSKWHHRKADLHREMAEEHAVEHHRIWRNEAEEASRQKAYEAAKQQPGPDRGGKTHKEELGDTTQAVIGKRAINATALHKINGTHEGARGEYHHPDGRTYEAVKHKGNWHLTGNYTQNAQGK